MNPKIGNLLGLKSRYRDLEEEFSEIMQNIPNKIKRGNLIQTKQSPLANSNSYYLFCEQDHKTYEILHGSIGIIVNIDRVSVNDNPIVDIFFSEENKILSISYHNDKHGNPFWCEILQ